jgi:hypothetical protein
VRSKKKRRKSPAQRGLGRHKATVTSALLDAFTARDLEVWETRSIDLQSYHDRVYYDLERQRAARYEELCVALRAAPACEVSVDGWVRVTDWRWSLTPLSPAGSLKGIGGRLNIGGDLDRARGQAFPCLYIAQDIETAYREYFGGPLTSRSSKLTLSELALRRTTSFVTFSLRGQLEQVFDLRVRSGLTAFAKIIAAFDLSSDTKKFAQRMQLSPRALIRTPHDLWKRSLAAPGQWRTEPQAFGIPAASQIFGRFVRDAGFEAVLYPSQQGGTSCLAVFPENLRAGSARVEVVGGIPPGASCTVLDKEHLCIAGLV